MNKNIFICSVVLLLVMISGCVGVIGSPVSQEQIDLWLSKRTFSNEYDCNEYSRDACRDLFDNNCMCVIGSHYGSNHMWIEVEGKGFETTTGKWVWSYDLQRYEPYGEPFRCNL